MSLGTLMMGLDLGFAAVSKNVSKGVVMVLVCVVAVLA
jgi:hypothetical protein